MAFVPPSVFTARTHGNGIHTGRKGALFGGGAGGGGIGRGDNDAGGMSMPAVARGRCFMLAVADGQDRPRPSTASRVDEQLLEAHATYEVWSEQLSSVSEETDPEWYATVCAKLAEAEEEVMRLVVAAPVATVADTGADLPPSPTLEDFINRSRRFAIADGRKGATAAGDDAPTSLAASDKALAVFTVRPPLSLKLPVSPGVLETYRNMDINDLGRLTLERSFEPLALLAVPKGVTVVSRGEGDTPSSASSVHHMLPDFLLPLPIDDQTSTPPGGSTPCSLELQSMPQSAVAQWFWNPLLTMVSDHFVGPQGHWRYYNAPPVAYCLVGLPFVGFFIAIEWVGKLHATIASDPFFVGTKQQEEMARKLPVRDAGPYMDMPLNEGCWASHRSAADVMGKVYTTKPMINDKGDSRFYKVVPCMAFDREAADELSAPLPSLMFRWLYSTYRRYEQILADAGDSVPSMLVPATLRFGAFSVLVDMPFVAGRDGVETDFQDQAIIDALADVVVWLAHRGLLYYDLRPANIRIDGEGGNRKVTLIDYDDMLVRDVGSLSTMALYETALQEEGRRRRYPLTKPLTHYTTVRDAIERAFASSPAPDVPVSAASVGGGEVEDARKSRFMRAWSRMGKQSAAVTMGSLGTPPPPGPL
ncbi:hypothetical protein MMPV_005999 [Pyropia vietnamensis]